jgi:hypothetical protein
VILERREPEVVIDDHDVRACKLAEEPDIAAVGPTGH